MWMKFMLQTSATRDTADAVKVSLLDKKPNDDGKDFTYQYNFKIQTNGFPLGDVAKFPFSEKVKYWAGIFKSSLGEVYMDKANSDMGLCLLMRVLYLYGALPAALGTDECMEWRKRNAPNETFTNFFAEKAKDPKIKDDPALLRRFQTAQAKLQVLLEESAAATPERGDYILAAGPGDPAGKASWLSNSGWTSR